MEFDQLIETLSISLLPTERNCIDIALSLQRLIREKGCTQDELAGKIGMNRSTLANYLRLLSLPAPMQKSLSEGLISMGHAKALLSIPNQKKQQMIHQKIIQKGLSVREAEKAASQDEETSETYDPLFLKPLKEEMQHKLGTKVEFETGSQKGRICIDYYNLDDLDRIVNIIRGQNG